ncbi:MAG: sensor histidine kinase, partial [Bacteroidota bacterium]
VVLILEIFFIFRPATKRVKKIVQDLSFSERVAKSVAAENKTLFIEKEKSLRELQTMNFAMDSAALYASLTTSGQVIHLSEKFKDLLTITQIPANTPFSELVTDVEGEQQYLNELLSTPRSSIWTEELNLTTKNGKQICLEISLLPVNQENVRQDVLLLCNDLTIRKEAQLEIERLSQEKFDLEISQQKLMSLRVVEAQEEERKRIAKDMHDGIGQMLTALKFNLESINLKKPEKAQTKLADIKVLAGDLIKSVRVATFNLTPPELSDYGIAIGLSKLVEGLNKRTGKNILFDNKTDFQQRFDTSTETNLYRITQEAINNAIKYAKANFILVTLSHSPNLLSIRIEDDGSGFDVDRHFLEGVAKEDGSGMGLAFMQERVKYINGRLFINSDLGEGTRITINMPLGQSTVGSLQ